MPTRTRANYTDNTIRGFINFAFHDYIASRTLLIRNLPTQGTILGITALEKLMKAIMLLMDQPIVVGGSGHVLRDMVQTIHGIDNTLFTQQDIGFIIYVDEAYQLRYPDNLSAPFEIFLPSLRILENLDRIFCKLNQSSHIIGINPEGKMYDVYVKKNSQLLQNCNVHFNSQLANALSDSKQKYAHYKMDENGLTETFCWTTKIKHSDNWGAPEPE